MTMTDAPQTPVQRQSDPAVAVAALLDAQQAERASETHAALFLIASVGLVAGFTEVLVQLLGLFA